MDTNEVKPAGQSISLKINLKIVCVLLLLVIAGMTALWKPWDSKGVSDRTVSADGTATIKETPDEYVFNPHFELKGKDQQQINKDLAKQMDGIVSKIKELGVKEESLKLGGYSYDNYYYLTPGTDEKVISVDLSITVDNKELAQKVQDYLLTTDAQGSITPYAQFSEGKKKELETKAREQAIEDAKKKAEQSASLLNAKLGDVIEVTESSNLVYPQYGYGADAALDAGSERSSLPVLPGQDEFTFSVFVKFEIK